MQIKLKICAGCNQERKIWKQYDGQRFCQSCWNMVKPSGIEVKTKIYAPIPKRSEKRQRQEVAYSVLRKAFLNNHPECQAKISKWCSGKSTECHHKAGRIGDLLCDDALFLAVCQACHHHIENNREQAIELGFSELRTNK